MYPVKLRIFEGPLDLLLHLIEKAEVDIYDIPIAEIADQYIQYLYSMQEFKIDIASEFIVMAATLLLIKSKMLLPKREEPEIEYIGEWEEESDPREELVNRLIEYKRYKMAAELLKEKEFQRNQIYTRPAEDLSLLFPPEEYPPRMDLSVIQLVVAFQEIWNKRKEENSISTVLKEEITVQDKMEEILSTISVYDKPIPFSSLFRFQRTRKEFVITFLALLELMKQRLIQCIQTHNFSEIEIIRLAERKG